MHLLVGLGNPGPMYSRTRHNVGFEVVDALAAGRHAEFVPGPGEFWWARFSIDGAPVIALKPTTFMNASGMAVVEALDRERVPMSNVLVIYDDFQLPLGALRLRPRGSDGGHNGMASVIALLGTEEVPRLRCGIAGPTLPADKELMADYVLSRFDPAEVEPVTGMVRQAAEACASFVLDGVDRTMNRFNTARPAGPESEQD